MKIKKRTKKTVSKNKRREPVGICYNCGKDLYYKDVEYCNECLEEMAKERCIEGYYEFCKQYDCW